MTDIKIKPHKETAEVPSMPPVYFHNGCWLVRVPGPTSTAGSNLFRGATVGALISSMQLGYFHAVWALNRQNARIKALEAQLQQERALNAQFLKGTKTR